MPCFRPHYRSPHEQPSGGARRFAIIPIFQSMPTASSQAWAARVKSRPLKPCAPDRAPLPGDTDDISNTASNTANSTVNNAAIFAAPSGALVFTAPVRRFHRVETGSCRRACLSWVLPCTRARSTTAAIHYALAWEAAHRASFDPSAQPGRLIINLGAGVDSLVVATTSARTHTPSPILCGSVRWRAGVLYAIAPRAYPLARGAGTPTPTARCACSNQEYRAWRCWPGELKPMPPMNYNAGRFTVLGWSRSPRQIAGVQPRGHGRAGYGDLAGRYPGDHAAADATDARPGLISTT